MTPCYNFGKQNRTSIAVLASMLISLIAVTGGTEPQDVTSQEFTPQDLIQLSQLSGMGTENQTQTAPATQNQTQTAPANLTRADMGPVASALNLARDALLGNGTLQDAYTSLSDADNALFRIAQDKGPSATTTIINMSKPVLSQIERAQNALLAGDAPRALDARNSAEVVMLEIIQGLPAEEEESSGEDEESSGEDEESSDEEEE
jgi:hypothetical protein